MCISYVLQVMFLWSSPLVHMYLLTVSLYSVSHVFSYRLDSDENVLWFEKRGVIYCYSYCNLINLDNFLCCLHSPCTVFILPAFSMRAFVPYQPYCSRDTKYHRMLGEISLKFSLSIKHVVIKFQTLQLTVIYDKQLPLSSRLKINHHKSSCKILALQLINVSITTEEKTIRY